MPCAAAAVNMISLQDTKFEDTKSVNIALYVLSKFNDAFIHSPPVLRQSHFDYTLFESELNWTIVYKESQE